MQNELSGEDVPVKQEDISPEAAALLGLEPESEVETQEEQVTQEPQETAEQEEGQPEETPGPKSLKDAAEKLQIDISELYAMQVPGLEMTLGELKDQAAEMESIGDAKAKAELQRQEADADIMRQRRELEAVKAEMGREPTEPELQRAQQKWNDYVTAESAKVLEVIPDWKDNATAKQELTEIGDLLSEYGVNQAEQAQIVDHRYTKLFRDFMSLRKLVKSAGEKELPKKGPVKTQKAGTSAKSGRDKAVSDFKAGKLSEAEAGARVILG